MVGICKEHNQKAPALPLLALLGLFVSQGNHFD